MSDPTILPCASPSPSKPSRVVLWTGRVPSALVFLFMAVGSAGVLIFKPEIAQKGVGDLGFPPAQGVPISLLEIAFAVLYVIPRTSILGGLLLTAYLGGAAAAHMRAEQYPQIAGPVIFGVVVWAGLFCREPRLRTLVPLRI